MMVSENYSSVAITFKVDDSNDLIRLNQFVEGLSRYEICLHLKCLDIV